MRASHESDGGPLKENAGKARTFRPGSFYMLRVDQHQCQPAPGDRQSASVHKCTISDRVIELLRPPALVATLSWNTTMSDLKWGACARQVLLRIGGTSAGRAKQNRLKNGHFDESEVGRKAALPIHNTGDFYCLRTAAATDYGI